MSEPACPFCFPAAALLFHSGELTLGLWDAFPVTVGHALLVPRRHVASWFEATVAEQTELVTAIAIARSKILERHQPHGFNIGVNVGEAGGQTVPHLHVHVIPRYTGDPPDARGGIRHVIPSKGNYLASSSGAGLVADATPREYARLSPGLPGLPAPPHDRPLVTGDGDPLLRHLRAHIDGATRLDIAVAFVQMSGVGQLREHLRDLVRRGGSLRVLTGDYLGITDPNALLALFDLAVEEDAQRVELRVFEAANRSFHPKAYVLHMPAGEGIAFVGSSNLSRSALVEGLEWNYRVITSRDPTGFEAVTKAFDELFRHPSTKPLTQEWVEEYRQRRPSRAEAASTDEDIEAPVAPPTPHKVQRAALDALEETRRKGNAAGLVVLATGLGKTWLAAFDVASDPTRFRRVLFVAHRDEILRQAYETFRRIRPEANLGLYSGLGKAPDADILFASIQTLGRQVHLRNFDPRAFDYIVVDEFHHAAASTYRRLIDHFEPAFLLGLTATPERTDGGDLLALCGENLVYRCDLADGIRHGLLCPFQYFGVPDLVDYRNIPWRSNRFDEAALEQALATEARAQNALEQYQQRGGTRTLGFCCSKRHADFMAGYFGARGVRVASVHSGPSSAPRAASLDALEEGELDIVFAVDMFNEGVDLPNVDTVMMLRPTESRILWLQQFGRGLRHLPDKRLKVIDYIGNHRTFLLKPRTLFDLAGNDAAISQALDRIASKSMELPPGCEVTYDLEAIDILRGLLRARPDYDALRAWYEDFKQRTTTRPRAVEAYHDGYNPRAMRKTYGSWLQFVGAMGDCSDAEKRLVSTAAGGFAAPAAFLTEIETTPMTKSFKMLVLLAMLNQDAFPGEIAIADLVEAFARLARRSERLRNDVGAALDDAAALERLVTTNPIEAWCGGRGTGGEKYFAFDSGRLRTTLAVPEELRPTLQELTREITEWRLAEYLDRPTVETNGGASIACKVSHANGRPLLFVPDRQRQPGIPEGWVTVWVDDEKFEANFVKIAVNVVRRPDNEGNELPRLLRQWFGPDVGLPGTDFQVVFESRGDGSYTLRPLGRRLQQDGLVLWRSYAREAVPALLGIPYKANKWRSGIVWEGQHILLFVTLEKEDMPSEHQYQDRFLAPDLFQWQSQNQTKQAGKVGLALREPGEHGVHVHLFVRRARKEGQRAAPFVYCGEPQFESWEGETPITFRWRLGEVVPERLRTRLAVPTENE